MAGGRNVGSKLDMSVDDNQFMFRRKFEGKFKLKGQRQITSFLLPSDSEENAVPYGLALLHCEQKPEKLRLSRNEKFIKITSEIKDFLKANIIDLVVYGTTAESDRCIIFEELCQEFVIPIKRHYIIREINPPNTDLTINRCTVRNSGFLPESFRLGQPTPGEKNDCTGEPLVLEDENIMQSVQEDSLPADLPSLVNEVVEREDVPVQDFCTPSMQPLARYRQVSKEKLQEVAAKKMRFNEGTCAESASVGVQSTSGGDHEKDKLLEQRASYLFDKPFEMDEFETTKHFKMEWVEDIKTHQRNLLPWLSIQTKRKVQQWFEYLPDNENMAKSRFRCRVCSKYFDELLELSSNHKSNLAQKAGVLHNDYGRNQELIHKHASTAIHQRIIEIKRKEKKQASLTTTFSRLEDEQQRKTEYLYKATSNMFRMIYTEVALNIPLSSHNTMVTLMHLNGAPKGLHHYERRSAQRIVDFISKDMHKKLVDFFKLRYGFDPVSLIVDGSTDVKQNHYLITYLQVLDNNNPLVYFYRLLPMRQGETAQDILDTILNAWEEDGIKEYMKSNLIGYGADGASVMMGKHKGLGKLLQKFSQRELVSVHCMAHRVHLSIRRAFSTFTFMNHFESAINGIYTFYYSHGHKRRNHLWNFAGGQILELSYIFETRWISSELSAIKRVIHNYKVLLGDLNELKISEDFDAKTQRTAAGMYTQLTDRYFIILLHFMADILNHLAKYSQEMQRRTGILIEQAELMDNLVEILEAASTQNEGNLINLLESAKCSNSGEDTCTVEDLEKSDIVFFFEHSLDIRPRSAYKPLSDIRESLVKALVKELRSYFPMETMKPFSILDPKKIPEKKRDQNFYGITEILSLARLYGQTDTNIVEDWKKLQEDLTISDEWCSMKGSSAKVFWKHYLTSRDLTMSDELRNIIRSVLVTPISSADAERGFSILFHTRSNRRSRLTAEHLDGILRLRINGPKNIALFPALRYAQAWHRQGRYLTDDSTRTRFPPSNTIADDDPEDTASKIFLDGSNLF